MTSAIRYRYSTEGTKREMEMYKHDVISHLPAISIHGYVGGGQIYALWLFMGVCIVHTYVLVYHAVPFR